jgi:ATP adenylyltransferase
MLESGTLWRLVKQRTAAALAAGELQPIVTRSQFIEDAGAGFLVRVISDQKGTAPSRGAPGEQSSPFLKHDDALFVCDVSQSHVARLNRFPVVENHLLIVTRGYENQESLLGREDFEALWMCMREYGSLGFYNGGPAAGASQSHKHLQMIPLPLAAEGPDVPLAPLIAANEIAGPLGRSRRLPFRHVVARLDPASVSDPAACAAASLALYGEMLRQVGLDPQAARLAPYNLLVTREWMLLVPRVRESFESISLNALAFAGALLVKNEKQLASLKHHGPLAALRAVVEEEPA